MTISLFALLACTSLVLSAADAPPVAAPLREGVLCVGEGDRVTSSDSSCSSPDRRAPDAPYLLRAGAVTVATRLRNGQPAPADSLSDVTFSIAGEGKRWPVAATIAITEGQTAWQWGLASAGARKKQTVRLAPGEYRLTFSAPGHQRIDQEVKVRAQTPLLDLGMIKLAASRTVSGIVISPERRPVGGCAILADGVALGFTDKRGRFDAELPVPAPRIVTLSHPQFAPRIVPIGADGDTPVGTVQLSRGGSVACTIDRHEIGDDAKISADLYQFIAGDTFRTLGTASLGSGETLISFANLDPGDYAILLRGDGPLEQMVVPIHVQEGALSDALVAIDPWRLHLTATHGDEPLDEGTVRLLNSGTLERRVWSPELRLDSTGAATVDVWQRGVIFGEVRSERVGFVFAPPALVVSTDEDRAEWEIVIPGQQVRGVVLEDATGEPIEGARVIHDSDQIGGAAKITDGQGRFSFDALHDGMHTFRVDSKAHLPTEPLSVTFPGTSERALEFRLRKGKSIRLDVRDSEGRGIPAAVVIDGCAAGSVIRGFQTDAAGLLDLPSGGGRHSVCVLPARGSFAIADVEPARETSQSPLQIRVPAPLVTIRVAVKTSDGLPVAQLGVLVVHNRRVVPPIAVYTIAQSQRRPPRTDGRGELLLAGMPVGHYELFVYTTEEEAVALASDRSYATPVFSGYLVPGEAALDVTIEARK